MEGSSSSPIVPGSSNDCTKTTLEVPDRNLVPFVIFSSNGKPIGLPLSTESTEKFTEFPSSIKTPNEKLSVQVPILDPQLVPDNELQKSAGKQTFPILGLKEFCPKIFQRNSVIPLLSKRLLIVSIPF